MSTLSVIDDEWKGGIEKVNGKHDVLLAWFGWDDPLFFYSIVLANSFLVGVDGFVYVCTAIFDDIELFHDLV